SAIPAAMARDRACCRYRRVTSRGIVEGAAVGKTRIEVATGWALVNRARSVGDHISDLREVLLRSPDMGAPSSSSGPFSLARADACTGSATVAEEPSSAL